MNVELTSPMATTYEELPKQLTRVRTASWLSDVTATNPFGEKFNHGDYQGQVATIPASFSRAIRGQSVNQIVALASNGSLKLTTGIETEPTGIDYPSAAWEKILSQLRMDESFAGECLPADTFRVSSGCELIVAVYATGKAVYATGKGRYSSSATSLEGQSQTEWNKTKNKRRCELIEMELDGNLSLEQREELRQLQDAMLKYRRENAPLPIEELNAELRKHGVVF